MLKRKSLVAMFALLLALSIIRTAFGHGAVSEYRFFVEDGVVKIEVHAALDSGEPMSEAQVVVFAPNDPANPWKTAKADKDGYYTFEPDLSIPGIWAVQMRLAGHGDMIYIEVSGDEAKTLKSESGEAAAEKNTEESLVEGPADEAVHSAPVGAGYSTAQIVVMAACVIWGFIGTALFFASRSK